MTQASQTDKSLCCLPPPHDPTPRLPLQKKACLRGPNCPYSHNVFEYFLHPSRYRTRLCDFGAECTRPVR